MLLSGDHAKIKDWRLSQSEAITRVRRPDLWQKYKKIKLINFNEKIEEINQANVKKIIAAEKNFQIFFQEILSKLELELLREKEIEFSILKVFVSQKKIEILTHHLQ